MHIPLITIGNSRGIRIPKAIIEEARLGEIVDLTVVKGSISIKPLVGVRAGWKDAFQSLASNELIDKMTSTDFDDLEWEW
jgi:antitoxin MazE